MSNRKTKTVYGVEWVYMDQDNYPTSRPLDIDLYEDKEECEARVLELNKGKIRPTGRWDADYYSLVEYSVIPTTLKEWP